MKNSAYVQEGETRLWVPGTAAADSRIRKVARAVKQYDECLSLARHELNGDWVVTIGEHGHPVFGFGQELPDPRDVESLLSKFDMKRNGPKILADLAAAGLAQAKVTKDADSERNGQLAERLLHEYEKVGAHTHPRIFVPRGI